MRTCPKNLRHFCAISLLLILFLSRLAGNAGAVDVTLAWDAVSDSDLAGYKVYYRICPAGEGCNEIGVLGDLSGVMVPLNNLEDRGAPRYPIQGLPEESDFVFVVTAYADGGIESGFSNEAFYRAPGVDPPDEGGDDVQPPTTPLQVQLFADAQVSADGIHLMWTESTDDTGVALYYVYRDGFFLDETVEPFFIDAEVTAGNLYTYTVVALDAAGNSSSESIPFSITVPADSNDDQDPSIPVFEFGEVTVDNNWTHVSFENGYSEPIVVARSLSINGRDPAVVRIRNVNSTGFDICLQEWEYLDGWHMQEAVGYAVMERGAYTCEDGTKLEASVFETARTNSFGRILFEQPFRDTPVVMSAVVSTNENDTVTGRMHSIDTRGFMYGMQEQEANSQSHLRESIAYIAWEPSMGEIDGVTFEVARTNDFVKHEFITVGFQQVFTKTPAILADMQTADGSDTASIRWQRKRVASVQLQVDEEQSRDDEIHHTSEVVGYMLFVE